MHAHFAKLRQNLEPNPTFSDIIQTRHAAVRQQLAPDSHLIGSLQRKTRIQPLQGHTFDIDILVVLDDFRGWVSVGGVTAQAALAHVHGKAMESDRYSVKNPTVDAPTITLQFASNVKVELVPAYRDQVGHGPNGVPHAPSGRAYWIPDSAGGWVLADYDYDAEYISAANGLSDGYLVPVIKILKAIKRLHFPQMKSFALEILAANIIPGLVSHYKNTGVPITFPRLLRDFFQNAQNRLNQAIAIPGSLSQPIIVPLGDVIHIGGQFETIRTLIASMDPLADGTRVERWRTIVGDPFPATL